MVNETQLKLIETIRQGRSKTRRNCQNKTGNTTKSRCKPNRRGRKLKYCKILKEIKPNKRQILITETRGRQGNRHRKKRAREE